MSNYLVPKYLYKSSDFISPTKINNDIAKIMDGVTITNTNNLTDILNSADQIQSTTSNYLDTVIPSSQTESIPTTTDSQVNHLSLHNLIGSQSSLSNNSNSYIYLQSLSSALQSVVNYINNGGQLNLSSIASLLSPNNTLNYSNYNLNNYTGSKNIYLTNLYPSSIINGSSLESILGSSNSGNNTSYQNYLTSSSTTFANSSEAANLFNYTDSSYVNDYLLSPSNIA